MDSNDPDREINRLGELIDRIDLLVATAQTTSNEEEKRAAIQQALKEACVFLTKINRRVETDIPDILANTPIGPQESGLPLTDLIAKHEELRPLREFVALKKEFRLAMSDLLESQGRLTREKIDAIMEQIEMLLPQILEQETGTTQLIEKFRMLKRLFCRSPDEGPPPPHKPDPTEPPRPPRGSEIREWLNTIAEYLKILGPVANLFVHTASPGTSTPELPVRELPPLVQPWHLRLLALMAMAGFGRWLHSQGHIPPEIVVKEIELVGAGAEKAERELVGA